ncbi:MAG: hypothetical protein ACJ04Q_05005 [Flavobacteriales bacterium]
MKENKKHLELLISKIDELVGLNCDKENYEDCAKLIDSKQEFEKYLDGKKSYEKIKNSVEYTNSKLSDILPKQLKFK